jgi:Xaa-Pro aminopeptidase
MTVSRRVSFLFIVALAALLGSCQAQSAALPSGPLTQEEVRQEIGVKLARVKAFLHEHHLAGVLLTRLNNFAWMTAGAGENEIVITSEIGAASLLVMADVRKYLILRLWSSGVDGLRRDLIAWVAHHVQESPRRLFRAYFLELVCTAGVL